jgi:hypothetical protein
MVAPADAIWYLPCMVSIMNALHQRLPIMVIFGAFLVLLLFLVPPHHAPSSEQPPRLRYIHVDGLRRTREAVVLDFIDIEAGDVVLQGSVQRAEDRLVKSDLFASVSIASEPVSPDTVDLRVTVDEKWTLVPIPFFSSGGDGFNGGLILIESNLFGRNKQLISAGFGGTDGVSGFFVFADPSVFGSSWSGSVSASAGRSEIETVHPDGTRIRRYTVEGQSAGLGIGYGFTPELRIRTRLGVGNNTVTEFRPGLDDSEPDGTTLLEPEIGIAYDGTRPVDVLLVGPQTSLRARWTAPETGWLVEGDLSWGFPLFETHRLRLMGSAGYGNLPVLAEAPISARDGFRTLPYQATRADRWSGGAVLYDLPVVSAGWGAFVLSHYWEAGVFDTELIDPTPYYGPGGGFRVYIRQVAIPAVGLDVAYNMADPAWVFSFTVGARM